MGNVLDRTGLAAGLESAGIAWQELADAERAAYAADGEQPSAMCWPTSYAQVAEALAVADRLGLAVAPRGAGSKVGLGNPPRALDLVLSTARLDAVVDYAPANLTVTVGAGMPLAKLQAHLAAAGQQIPLDPPNGDQATLGGILATNATGPRRLGFGGPRDLVIGTRAATTRGTVVRAGGRVVKNVAGYDLNKLYVGSLGTLVVLVEVDLKVAPRPAAQTTVIGRFARVEQVAEATRAVIRSPLLPAALDLLNGPAARALDWAGLPDPGDGYLLAGLGAAPGAAVWRQRDDLGRLFRAAGANPVVDLTDPAVDDFWRRVAERPGPAAGPGDLRAKVAVPLCEVPAALRALEQLGRLFGVVPAIGGQAGSGVLYVQWRLPEAGPKGRLAATATTLAAIRSTCGQLGGSLVIEAAPRALKEQLDVWGDVGPSLRLMQRLKAALDPNATLNPGRFVGGI